ncbi:hypothetical protein KY290_012961 [Solanum tuberosum]|uniref:Reverse transcriptase domain-containing protein n=1 Tax=Solanum tuberosum TaxID=4113 RepID=A0ABQ7VL27_SOLTU|nr:hypothetical protein KY290_012961 [Solanum tuberosum]
MSFPKRFIRWVMECIQTVNFSIVVNGEHTEPFDAARWLRQGDPMSPYLFAIAMEYLSRFLNELQGDKGFKFHPRCAKLIITHLSFADDLIMFSRGDMKSVAALQECFMQFSNASGLKANLGKSCAYFRGMQAQVKEDILHHLGYSSGKLPFKYLGVPLSTKKLLVMEWQSLIEKIISRISSWTTKKLLYAGRVQLVQTAARI